MEIEQEVKAISASGLFDEVWYRNTYGDVPAGVDAIEHYVRIGRVVGRRIFAEADPDVLGELGLAGPNSDKSFADFFQGRTLSDAYKIVCNRQPDSNPGQQKLPLTALVVSWDIGHNPLGRAYMLAEAVDRCVRHTIVAGFQFSKYGNALWSPLANSRLPVIPIPGAEFPDFLGAVERVSDLVRPDIVIACKPRLPSLQLALRISDKARCPMILDIDDHELAFFKNKSSSLMWELETGTSAFATTKEPYEEIWTRLCETLSFSIENRLISNSALKERFGGTLIPHVRDETRFVPALPWLKKAARRNFGVPDDAKVVLFFGTPRLHKGLGAIAEAIGSISDPDFRLVVVGTAPDRSVTSALEAKAPGRVHMVDNQPFDSIPDIMAMADVVALPQDVEHPIAHFQLPAKAIDAIAMNVPLLVTKTKPLMDLVRDGVATPIEMDDLAPTLERVVSSKPSDSETAAKRNTFLEKYSYRAMGERMRKVISHAIEANHVAPEGLGERLVKSQRRLFGPKPGEDQPRTEQGRDVVLFWKQNDTTLYGRRHDMVIKYLASRPDVRRVMVFDHPISEHDLIRFRDGEAGTQHRLVYTRTIEKTFSLCDSGKVRYRTFVMKPGIYHMPDKPVPGKKSAESPFTNFVRDECEREGVDPSSALFFLYPKNYFINSLLERFRPSDVIVDVVDDHRAWPGLSEQEKKQLTDHYTQTLTQADLVLTNCHPVKLSMEALGATVKVIQNGCESNPEINAPSHDARFDELKTWQGPIAGFVGNLETKIDIDLLDKLATELPDTLIVLVGSTHANPAVRSLSAHPNVLMPGVVSYENVPAWIAEFTVGLIPHKRSELTESMNPLKLYVYAAQGLPVVSTSVSNLAEDYDGLHIAKSVSDFVEQVKMICAQPMMRYPRAYAERNSWHSRLSDCIDAFMAR